MGERLHGITCDPLACRAAEIRRLVEERDKWRDNVDEIKQRIHAEVRAEVIDAIRRMPFLQRVKLCFSPFAVEPEKPKLPTGEPNK